MRGVCGFVCVRARVCLCCFSFFCLSWMQCWIDIQQSIHSSGTDDGQIKILIWIHLICWAGAMKLFFGCRRADEDFLYKKELLQMHEQSAVDLVTAFSRETAEKVVFVFFGCACSPTRLPVFVCVRARSLFVPLSVFSGTTERYHGPSRGARAGLRSA